MQERIDNIETKLMAAEDQIDELNRTVWRQQQEIDQLRKQLTLFAQQVKALQPVGSTRPEDEIPPHW